MGDLSKEEIKAMKAKEAKNRKAALAASAIHDAEVMDKMKGTIGMPPAGAPSQPPAPADQMGNVTGMKKGGTASSRADGCAIRGKTRA